MPEDTEQTALALNEKSRNLHRNDFLKFAEECGIPAGAAEKMIGKVLSMREVYHTLCTESFLPEDMKTLFTAMIDERIDTLTKHG